MIYIKDMSSLTIKPYGLFAVIAAVTGMIVFLILLKNKVKTYRLLFKLFSAVSVAVMLFGVLLGYIVEVAKKFYNGNPDIFMIKDFGFIAYGGIFGALIASYFVVRRYRLDKYIIMDSVSSIIPIVHGIARAGCLFSGCCCGKEYYGFLSVYYETSDRYCFPFPIAEGAMDITLGLLLIYIFKKNNFNGGLMYIYLLIYSVYRFILEFFRGDEIRGIFGILSTSQYISIIVFGFAVIKLILYYRRIKMYE